MTNSRRILSVMLATAALVLPCAAQAITVTFQTWLGDVVERTEISVRMAPSGAVTSCLRGNYSRSGDAITLRMQPGSTCGGVELDIGKLDAGTYNVYASLVDRGGVVLEQATSTLKVVPLEGRCNADPLAAPAIFGFTAPGQEAQRTAELAADVEFSTRFPDAHAEQITYGVAIHAPPLQDVSPMLAYLRHTYAWLGYSDQLEDPLFRNVSSACAPSGRDVQKSFFEYVNVDIGTYLYTSDEGEMTGLAEGTWGHWVPTGHHFMAIAQANCARETGLDVVYRFVRAAAATRTHVFTRDREECFAIDKVKTWHYQGVPFFAAPTEDDGTCADSFDKHPRIPLYRLWRPFGEPAHRLTNLRAVVDEMTAQGWVDEGARMCVPPNG